jgi:hypothetical protein
MVGVVLNDKCRVRTRSQFPLRALSLHPHNIRHSIYGPPAADNHRLDEHKCSFVRLT